MFGWMGRIVKRAITAYPPLLMTVSGDEEVGYWAKYPWDKRPVWASKRDTAIVGCAQRARE